MFMAVLLVFSVMPVIAAQDTVADNATDASDTGEIEVVDAGVTPDSAFYGLERAMERIRLSFMRNKANRAKYKLRLAEERLAEAEEMLEEDNDEAAQEAEEAHDELIEEVEEVVEELETNGDEETAEKALEDVETIQLGLLSHSERVAFVHNRILERMRAGNASEEKLAHIGEVFARIEAKAQEMEQKMQQKRENIRTRYKVLSEKDEDELTEREKAFLERVEESKQRREEQKERIRENTKLGSGADEDESEDEAEVEDESESEDSTEEQGQRQAGQQ